MKTSFCRLGDTTQKSIMISLMRIFTLFATIFESRFDWLISLFVTITSRFVSTLISFILAETYDWTPTFKKLIFSIYFLLDVFQQREKPVENRFCHWVRAVKQRVLLFTSFCTLSAWCTSIVAPTETSSSRLTPATSNKVSTTACVIAWCKARLQWTYHVNFWTWYQYTTSQFFAQWLS